MENASYISLSRQMALAREMTVIANNIANMNTPAYRSEATMFAEFLNKTPSGERLSFTEDVQLVRNLAEGQMQVTDNPLDLAISGKGYFVVDVEGEERYTRNGSFRLSPDGELVTNSGHPVLSDGGDPIVLPDGATNITVTRDGTISSSTGPLGKIKLVGFEQEQALQKGADGLYTPAEGQDPLDGEELEAEVIQGMIEGSNVVGVVEMTRMIDTMRSYTSTAKFIKEDHDRQMQAIRNLANTKA